MHDGLIFDLDGTLWDSTAACVKGWNEALGTLGVTDRTMTDRDIRGIMGLTHEEIYRKLFPEVSDGERKAIARALYEQEIEVIRREGGALFPGVAEGLGRLAGRYPLFIVSNCLSDYLGTFLDSSRLGALFKDTECYGGTGKPKAENIRLIVTRNRLKAPAYIGDTAGDQTAAVAAGVPYFHVNWGFGEPRADCWRFDDFPELVRFFLEE